MVYSKGGTRKEIHGTLVDSEVVVYTEDETDGIVNPAELVIGKKKGSELKMSVIVFDLKELFDEQEDQVMSKC